MSDALHGVVWALSKPVAAHSRSVPLEDVEGWGWEGVSCTYGKVAMRSWILEAGYSLNQIY